MPLFRPRADKRGKDLFFNNNRNTDIPATKKRYKEIEKKPYQCIVPSMFVSFIIFPNSFNHFIISRD